MRIGKNSSQPKKEPKKPKAWSAKAKKLKKGEKPKKWSARDQAAGQKAVYGKKGNPQVLGAKAQKEARRLLDEDRRNGNPTNFADGRYELTDDGRPYIPKKP